MMKNKQEIYSKHGALVVVNDAGTYKGWNPSDSEKATKAIANTSGTGIGSQSEAEKIETGEKLPPVVNTEVVSEIKSEYDALRQ